jgi:hypothetical protein
MKKMSKKIIVFSFLISFLFFSQVFAQEKEIFFIERNYDLLSREKVLATKIVSLEKTNFFVEDDYWFSLSQFQRDKILAQIKTIGFEFENKIYPILTQRLGKEPAVGVNGDPKITILLSRMKENFGGYLRNVDNFEKILAPNSNERKILYLNVLLVENPVLKSTLAHEFSHLIIFNQKKLILNVEEERWVQEMISEIAPTLVGENENLKQRITIFQKHFNTPLLEWKERAQDYAILSIFGHYLLDQFGDSVFSKILNQKEIGISGIEKATQKPFAEIFRNFAISNFLNDCSLGKDFCYQNENLKNLKIVPEVQILPTVGESVFKIFRDTKDFAQNFYTFYGGKGNLEIVFEGDKNGDFNVTLIVCDKNGKCSFSPLILDENQKGKTSIANFSQNYNSFSFIVFSKKNKKFFENQEAPKYNFSIQVSFKESPTLPPPPPPTTTLPILSKFSCTSLDRNLKYGMAGNDVKCLQEVLKKEGPEIYPEGLVTGYFGPLTLQAVKRFQQKYWQEILAPWGLTKDQPTGFVGQTTRAKINQILVSQ